MLKTLGETNFGLETAGLARDEIEMMVKLCVVALG